MGDSGRQRASRLKLKTPRYKERLQKFKEHFKNIFWDLPQIPGKYTEESTDDQLDIKLGEFKAETPQASREYQQKYGRQEN